MISRFKAKNDLQTEADRSAQTCIIASLSREFPNVNIVGEEGGSDLRNVRDDWIVNEYCSEILSQVCPLEYVNVNERDLTIWVDPLDGTSEYTQGFVEHVTVLIGIAIKHKAIGGIIHQPFYKTKDGMQGRTIWGLKKLGVGGLVPQDPPSDQFILTTTRSHSTEMVQKALDALNPTEILRVGGAGYKVLQLLEGKAHAYVFASPGCKKWDTCAPEAVLEAHGGILTDISGDHYTYQSDVAFPNKSGVLATAKGVSHKTIIDNLPKEIKDLLKK